MGRNVGWLAGSTGFTAIASLAYIALAARTLGPRGFGSFTLILTYGQLIANLAQFQSWKAVIRFGAAHHASGSRDEMARLFGYAAALDLASAVIGAAVAVLLVGAAGPLLHWTSSEDKAAAWFGAALLLTSGTTPSGMLRLLDRFDLLVYTEAIAPLTRLAGCLLAWAAGADVIWFLAIWALAPLLQGIAQWGAVLGLGQRLTFGRRAFGQALRENRRLWPFMLKTNFASSLSLFWMQLGTLVVGAVAGPVESGGFRLAHRFAQAMTRPIDIATRALYPELARLVASDDHATSRRVLLQVTWVSAAFACVVIVVTGIEGKEILRLVAGRRFEYAYEFLFLLSISAAIDVVGFGLEPFHNAHGRAGRVLRTYLVAALAYAGLLAALIPTLGATGAAFAAIGASLITLLQLAMSAAQLIRQPNTIRSVRQHDGDGQAIAKSDHSAA
jgi:O-antigen/teichoic acid export membrane protein